MILIVCAKSISYNEDDNIKPEDTEVHCNTLISATVDLPL